MVKFYSDKTNKYYATAEEAEKAEQELREQENRERIRKEREAREKKEKEAKFASERKEAATKVEEARKTMVKAQHDYREALEAFVKKYGTFHLTLTDEDAKRAIPTLFDFFDLF